MWINRNKKNNQYKWIVKMMKRKILKVLKKQLWKELNWNLLSNNWYKMKKKNKKNTNKKIIVT